MFLFLGRVHTKVIFLHIDVQNNFSVVTEKNVYEHQAMSPLHFSLSTFM